MFPYPSGTAMHVWHASNFLVTEIMARYHRMRGDQVVFPIGYDSFWLPTENFAIKNNKSARQATEDNIVYFEEQLKGIDFSFDEDRKFKTSDPEYYKWTQWIFTKLYQHNLVYRKDWLVNWCNGCQTVLANDQVVDGRCERCETEIIQKKHPQWYIKITDYADQLLDYSDCDRPEETKIHQTNWIGKSKGAEIDFTVQWAEQIITVFTTRPDTIYGVTAIVLAPENDIIDQYMTDEKKSELANYRKTTALKTNIERQSTDKDKTWFDSGVQVIHPLTGELVPVWFADYVLPDYATGAVMFVPAHDERDDEFSGKYNIWVKVVIVPEKWQDTNEFCYTWTGFLINSAHFNWLDNITAKAEITKHLESIGKGKAKITYRLRDWSVSRQRYWGSPIPVYYTFEDNDDGRYTADNPHPDKTKWIPHLIPESELPVILPLDLPNYKPAGKSPLEDHPSFKYYTKKESALLIHGRWNKPWDWNCLDAISQDLISKWYEVIYPELDYHTTFSFEDVLSKLQSYHANIVIGHSSWWYLARHYASRNTVDQIITISSTSESTAFDDDFVSTVTQWLWAEDGKKYIEFHSRHIDFTHMLQNPPKAIDVFWEQDTIINESIREWFVLFNSTTILPWRWHMWTDESNHDYLDLLALINIAPARDITYLRECDTLDTFMCSSFYFLRFCDPHNIQELISPEAAKMMPVDLYVWGKEHTVGHLLYSRFIYKFLKGIGAVACDSKEPFRKLVHQGMVHASDGRKMSKRWGNVIDPMGIINEYGSDTLRTYTMFMWPVEASKNWNPDAVAWVYRFIGRVAKLKDKLATSDVVDTQILSILHQTIKWVTEDIEALKFNTAVSKLMIMTNAFAEAQTVNQSDYLIFLKLCAPFATHMTQQIWSELGQEGSIHDSSWPVWDDALIATWSIDLPIQVNGKMRGTIAVASGATQDEVIALARSHDNIAKWLEWEIIKIIYVQDKICNVIIKYSESH